MAKNNNSLGSFVSSRLSIVTDALYHLFASEEEYRQHKIGKIEKELRERYATDPQTQTFNEVTEETMYNLVRQWDTIRRYKQGDFMATGFPTVSPDAVISFYKPLVDRVCGASGMNPDDQKAFLIPAIRTLVHCVHLMPASSSYHHPGVGGLVEHTLELAYCAATSAKGKAFPKIDSVTKTRIQNSRWQFAVILCSFFHDIGKVVTDVTIKNWNKTAVFTPHSDILWNWLLANPGETYHIYWNGAGKGHEKAMVVMLKSNLFPAKAANWLGETICREIDSFLQSGGKESVFAEIVAKADTRSTAEDRKMGQWDYRIGREVNRSLHNVFTAFKRLLYATTQSRDERGRPLPIQTENDNVITGWDCNYPDSALFYPDSKHLFIRWDRLLDVRTMMEEFNSGQPVFDLSVKTQDLSVTEKEEARVKVVQALHHSNYLETPLPGAQAGDGNKAIAWRVHPIDRSTGEILEAVDCICLNKSARDKLFRDIDPIIFDKQGCCIDWGSAKDIGVENDQYENVNEVDQPQPQGKIPTKSIPATEIQDIDESKKISSSEKDSHELALAELLDPSNENPEVESANGQSSVGISDEESLPPNKEKNPNMNSSGKTKVKPDKGLVNLANLGKMKSIGGHEDNGLEETNEDKPKSAMDSFLPVGNRKATSKSSKLSPACGKEKRKGVVPPDRPLNDKKVKQRQIYELTNIGVGEFTEAQLNQTLESLLHPNKNKPQSCFANKTVKQKGEGQNSSKSKDQEPKTENSKSHSPIGDKKTEIEIPHSALMREAVQPEAQRSKEPIEYHAAAKGEMNHKEVVNKPLFVPGEDDEESEEERPIIQTTKVNVRFLDDNNGKLAENDFLDLLVLFLSKAASESKTKRDSTGPYVDYEYVEALARKHEVDLLSLKVISRNRQRSNKSWVDFDKKNRKVRLLSNDSRDSGLNN